MNSTQNTRGITTTTSGVRPELPYPAPITDWRRSGGERYHRQHSRPPPFRPSHRHRSYKGPWRPAVNHHSHHSRDGRGRNFQSPNRSPPQYDRLLHSEPNRHTMQQQQQSSPAPHNPHMGGTPARTFSGSTGAGEPYWREPAAGNRSPNNDHNYECNHKQRTVPLKKRQRFPRTYLQRSRYGPKSDHSPSVLPSWKSPTSGGTTSAGRTAATTHQPVVLKTYSVMAMESSNVATTGTTTTLPMASPSNTPSFEDDSHCGTTSGIAMISDGCQSPDNLLETSTMASSSAGGSTDPVVSTSSRRSKEEEARDLPRHIETPKTLHLTTLSPPPPPPPPHMDTKLPLKSPTLPVQSDDTNHHHRRQESEGNANSATVATLQDETTKAQSSDFPQSFRDTKLKIQLMHCKAATQVEVVTPATMEEGGVLDKKLTAVPKEESQEDSMKVNGPDPDPIHKAGDSKTKESEEVLAETPSSSATLSSSTTSFSRMLKKYRRVQIGARVSVYWDGEDTYFEGTITAERPGKKKRFYLEYDDGDEEWINLRKHTWRLLSGGRPKRRKKKEKMLAAADDPQDSSEVTMVSEPMPVVEEAKPIREGPPKKVKSSRQGHFDSKDWMHDDQWVSAGAKKSDSDSETDEEEVMHFARQMLGVPKTPSKADEGPPPDFGWDDLLSSGIHIPISEKVKLGRRRNRAELTEESGDVAEAKRTVTQKRRKKLICRLRIKARAPASVSESVPEETKEVVIPATSTIVDDSEEAKRRRKEEARTLTAEEVKAILGEEDSDLPCSSNWVRRSARMPSRSVLNTPKFKQLIEKLKINDPDMVVLKMKKYLSDPDCPPVCIDTVLDALEENTNCQSLYIQNFNEGCRDEQVLRLLQILQKPSCNIWCLNIGETYNVQTNTWKTFARGLKDTKITHMYASEHTISSDLKDKIRSTIRDNRKKHSMHIDPENLDVIVKCTHCWWNPINAKVLRPHLHRKGYAHILEDKDAQGVRGTNSGAALV